MLEAQPTPPEPEPASDVTEQREEQQPPQPDRAPLPDALRGTRRYLPPGALPHLPSMLPEQQHAHSTRVFSSHSASSSVMAALQVSLDTPGARDSTSPTKTTNPRGKLPQCHPDDARERFQTAMTQMGPTALVRLSPRRRTLRDHNDSGSWAGYTQMGMQPPRGSPIMRQRPSGPSWDQDAAMAAQPSMQSMFGRQKDSRKRSTTGPVFVPFGEARNASLGRWSATASSRFYSLNVASHIHLGKEGQGPQRYKVPGGLGSYEVSSVKPNSPGYSFGQSRRFGYSSVGQHPNFAATFSSTAPQRGQLRGHLSPGPAQYWV